MHMAKADTLATGPPSGSPMSGSRRGRPGRGIQALTLTDFASKPLRRHYPGLPSLLTVERLLM
jgi:hypothetical protein